MPLPNELGCSGIQDQLTRRDTVWRIARKPILVTFAVLVTAALGVAGWQHRYSRSPEVPPTPARPSQSVRPIAVLLTDPSRTPASAGSDPKATEGTEQPDTTPEHEISIHPLDQFRDDLRKALSQELAPTYPQLPDLNREPGNRIEQDYRDSVFRFLDFSEKTPEAQQPAMLLAADLMLQALWCPSEQGARCDQLRNQFSEHQLTLANSHLRLPTHNWVGDGITSTIFSGASGNVSDQPSGESRLSFFFLILAGIPAACAPKAATSFAM